MKTMEMVRVRSDDIKGNEMDKTCNTHGKDEKCLKGLVGLYVKKSEAYVAVAAFYRNNV
jgi:hypothetical protein